MVQRSTSSRGIDPHGLRQVATALDGAGRRADGLGHVAGSRAGAVASELRSVADDLRRRAAAVLAPPIEPASAADHAAVDGWARTAAILDPTTWAAWRRGSPSSGRRLRTPDRWVRLLAGETPRRVRRAVDGAAPSSLAWLAQADPAFVSRTDGMPMSLRASATRRLVLRHRDDLGFRLRGKARALADLRQGYAEGVHDPDGFDRLADLHLEATRWADPSRRLVAFDPAGDGRAVEVFGDLDEARRVVILVPGMGNDLAGFSFGGPGERGGLRIYGRRLHEAIDPDIRPHTAVIVWLGYDAPDHLIAASRPEAADAGADALRRFIAGIDAIEDRHVTVIGHSYGSVVAGTAAARGLDVDDLVFVGSPGTGLADADAARLRPGGRVWAGLATMDPIAHAAHPLALVGSLAPGSSIGTPARIHGPSPIGASFGSVVFDTGTARGHSGYFTAAGVVPLARIVSARRPGGTPPLGVVDRVAAGRRRAAPHGTPDARDRETTTEAVARR